MSASRSLHLRRIVGVTAAALLALPAPLAPAAAPPKPGARPAAPAVSAAPAVGAWATYRWTSTVTESVPVLIQQPRPGEQTTWSVAQENAAPAPFLVTYAAVREDRRTYTLQIVTQERADGPPLSVTQVTIDRASSKAVRSLTRRGSGLVPTPESALRPLREAAIGEGRREEVTVPAGRFTAVRGTAQGAEVWVSDDVPLLGLVKGVWRQGTLELVESGASGAVDHFKS